MEQESIRQLQDEAISAYERLPQPEAAANAQVVMLAEIALQLAKLNEHLKKWAILPVWKVASEDEAGTHPPNCDCYYCSAGEEES